ncbi:MAG TPA: NADH-quinone oxidoreductase subunit L [Gemmatimonadaceae bacterium]|nr:NADH-quinone oxidoreductase subunit L [Gemmatimonadaceae bacterium]
MLLQTASAAPHPLAGTVADLLWLVPLLPLLGFLVNGALALFPVYIVGPADPSKDPDAGHLHPGDPGYEHHPDASRFAGISTILGPGVVALAFVVSVLLFGAWVAAGPAQPFVQTYGAWMPAGDLRVDWALQLDQLSLTMILLVTGVGTLIHLFSVGYMEGDARYGRYFAYLNLFVFFMLVLVLGANYLVLYVGWEGVGLCSYLLISFWFSDEANANAGKKAFIVNRIGDFGFLVAMFLLFANFGALDFAGVDAAVAGLPSGNAVITAACLFLFLGCAGKSAQMPLYLWLPDAMAGPTPVSALIHAATMVTAGVYLVTRSAALFALSPVACLVVALVGAVTAFFAATVGLKQWDIKKVLAYSTISQLGYMFVAVGIGAYTAGIFHLATHAFFKALLFLGSGSVIWALHRAYHHTHREEDAQDMRNMGGLRRWMPWTAALMWVGTLAIAGIPLFSGFFSKDQILEAVVARALHSPLAEASLVGLPGRGVLWLIYVLALSAAFLTALYMTRLMLYTFHGPNRTGATEQKHLGEAPSIMTGPLVVLGVLSAVGGWLNLPTLIPLGRTHLLDRWLAPVTEAASVRLAGDAHLSHSLEIGLVAVAVLVAVAGMLVARFALRPARLVPKAQAPASHGIGAVLEHAYSVDAGVDRVIVQPTVTFSRKLLWRGLDVGVIDGFFVNGSASVARFFAWAGSRAQSGNVGNYAWVIVVGVLVLMAVLIYS